tara:strand:+ start:38 stop:328 length:291 start_codon:yes stop_codon:yes gene_type:complete
MKKQLKMTAVVDVLKFGYLIKNITRQAMMNSFIVLALIITLLLPTPSHSDTNHFGAGGIFELDLGDSEMPLTPKQEREQKLYEEQLKKQQQQSSDQ